MIEVTARKLTDADLLRYCNSATMRFEKDSRQHLESAYKMEHSPIRTQEFIISMRVPAFVSVHFVRHKIGVEHFVGSNRADLGGDSKADRWTPTNHVMKVNAAALIAMSRLRLCKKASEETQETMRLIRVAVGKVDHHLAKFMVPNCIYRNGLCGHPCGAFKKFSNETYHYYKEIYGV